MSLLSGPYAALAFMGYMSLSLGLSGLLLSAVSLVQARGRTRRREEARARRVARIEREAQQWIESGAFTSSFHDTQQGVK